MVQFRGPAASGVDDGAPLPTTFDQPAWRTPIPGLAHASPVVLDGRVFVATAVIEGDDPELKVGLYGAGDSAADLVETEFRLIALDAASGDVLWNTLTSKSVPSFGRHTKATQANCTPAAAAGRVVVYSYGNIYRQAGANQESGRLLPVGSFAPNGFGLRDMTGNAFEWVADVYDQRLHSRSDRDAPPAPLEADGVPRHRALRGGSFVLDGMYLRNSFRMRHRPDVQADDFGFRVLCEAGKTPAGR